MPSPEGPERAIPDVKSELVEVADAQAVKVETQKSKFAELDCAKLRLTKEAEDVLRIAYENSEDPRKFILDGVEEYAESEGISFLAAGARVAQYLSPEWKEVVDYEVRKYFENFDFSEFVRLPKGGEEIETLKILCEEGYSTFFVVAVHYRGDPDGCKKAFDRLFLSLEALNPMFDVFEKKPFDEKERLVLGSLISFPEAREYFEKMKKNGAAEEYKRVIDLAYMHVVLSLTIEEDFPGFDCDERTLLFQKFAMDMGLEVGNYMGTRGHAVLKLDGFPLVFDTFDMKIRTAEECARRVGYGGEDERRGSYFWRDGEGEYLARYDDSDDYPKKIAGYERVEGKPYLVTRGDDMAGILFGMGSNLKDEGKISEAILCYKQILNVWPNFVSAYVNLSNLVGDEEGASYLEEALKIDPNDTSVLGKLASRFDKKGDTDKAIIYYQKALKLDPNDALNLALLAGLWYKQGAFDKAISCLEKALKIDPDSVECRELLRNCQKISELGSKLDPNSAFQLAGLGGDWYKRKALDKAIFYFEKALKADPDNAKYGELLHNVSVLYLYERFGNLEYDFNGLGGSGDASKMKFAEEVVYICSHRKVSVLDIKWEEIFPKGGSVDYEAGSVAYDQGKVNLEVLGKVENWIRNNLG